MLVLLPLDKAGVDGEHGEDDYNATHYHKNTDLVIHGSAEYGYSETRYNSEKYKQFTHGEILSLKERVGLR